MTNYNLCYHWILISFSLQSKNKCSNLIQKIWLSQSENIHVVTLPTLLMTTLQYFKIQFNTQFNQLADIAAVDFPNHELRFSLNYILLSINYSQQLNILIKTNELNPIISITHLYESANWSEREIWDLFGIFFIAHERLDRILTDYGFEGHALRKSYPLTGFYETYFRPDEEKFQYLTIFLPQEIRSFGY